MIKDLLYPKFLGLFVLLGLLSVLYSCQPDALSEDYLETQDLTTATGQEDFTLTNYKDEWVKNNLEVDWKNPVIIQKTEKLTVEEFSTNLFKVLSPQNAEDDYEIKIIYKVLKTTSGTTSSYSIIQFQAFEDRLSAASTFSLKNSSQFNGGIAYFDLKGDRKKWRGIRVEP